MSLAAFSFRGCGLVEEGAGDALAGDALAGDALAGSASLLWELPTFSLMSGREVDDPAEAAVGGGGGGMLLAGAGFGAAAWF